MSMRPEVVLLLGAGGVGLLALLFPLLPRRGEATRPLPVARMVTALGVVALLFGLTRLRGYPFAPGGTLGAGLALGGAIALATAAFSALWPGSAMGTVGAGGGALLGVAVVLLWLRGYPNAALVGFAAGHAVATLLAAADGEEQPGVWAGPVMAAILAGATLLALARASAMSPAERLALEGKVWWAWPAVVMAAVLVGQMVALSLFGRRAGAYLGAGLIAALLLFALWLRFPRYAPLLAPVGAGFMTALLVLGCSGVHTFEHSVPARHPSEPPDLTIPTPERPGPPLRGGAPQTPEPLIALLVPAMALVLLATAYRLYSGYGIALAALGTAALLPWLAEREPRAAGRGWFGLLAAAVLFRVYYNSYDLRGGDIPLTAHYAMVSLISGALAPFALAAVQSAVGSRQSSGAGEQAYGPALPTGRWLLAAGCCLLAAVALPALLTLFWGQKAGGGLLLGLVIGQGFRLVAALLDVETPGRLAVLAEQVPEAALLVMAWVTVQLLDRVEAYGLQLLRVQRLGLTAVLVIACLAAILYRAWRGTEVRSVSTGRA